MQILVTFRSWLTHESLVGKKLGGVQWLEICMENRISPPPSLQGGCAPAICSKSCRWAKPQDMAGGVFQGQLFQVLPALEVDEWPWTKSWRLKRSACRSHLVPLPKQKLMIQAPTFVYLRLPPGASKNDVLQTMNGAMVLARYHFEH